MKTYLLKINGEEIKADFDPDYLDMGQTLHIVFHGKAISESGYQSYFANGTAEDYGITPDNTKEELQKVAEKLAEEETARKVKRKRKCVSK